MATRIDRTIFGTCTGCDDLYPIDGYAHCTECEAHFGCCEHASLACHCDVVDAQKLRKTGCARVHCRACDRYSCAVCDLYSSDCDEASSGLDL
jgi:hypothetical protein